MNNLVLRFMWRHKGPRIPNTVLKKNRAGGLILLDVLTSYKTVLRQWGIGEKNRPANQWNRMESLEIDPCKYNQPIFDKETKIIQWNLKVVSSTKTAWTTGHPHAKKYIYFHTDLIPSWRINSKWIIDINVKYTTVKLEVREEKT